MACIDDHDTAPYFPNITECLCYALNSGTSPPVPPKEITPIFDTEKCKEPLPKHEILDETQVYGEQSNLDAEVEVPSCPAAFNDPYLYPTLTQNEYRRLTMLWYYTRGLDKDKAFLNKIEQMINLLSESFSWEFGLIGILENDHYIRLATANLPLAKLPRRESTCSHTVNMPPGTVFMMTDMSTDWRFKNSPHVKFGGLRAYAGTPLKFDLLTGESIILGSLCIASEKPQMPLTDEQKTKIIRTADMVAAELVSRTRLRLLDQRQTMAEQLASLKHDSSAGQLTENTIGALRSTYPDCDVLFAATKEGTVYLQNGSTMIPMKSIRAGLWEDTKYIHQNLQFGLPPESTRPVRAIISILKETNKAVVVVSTDLRLVFDDLDSWFIDSCAQLIDAAHKDIALRKALDAKRSFLRSITHQLRTPIHGILSSTEILEEELGTMHQQNGVFDSISSKDRILPSTCLGTIKQSGMELMTTINSILRFNAFEGENHATLQTEYNLESIEVDVLNDILPGYLSAHLEGLSLIFEFEFVDQERGVRLDANILKELLKCLLTNAIDATVCGSITVKTKLCSRTRELTIDVIDSGVGIAPEDQQRIFLPFEKVNFTRGAGLGLSLATHMAHLLDGTLELCSSQPGKGSHFQLHLSQVNCITSAAGARRGAPQLKYLSQRFYTFTQLAKSQHLVTDIAKYLKSHGFQHSDLENGSTIFITQLDPFQDCSDILSRLQKLPPHPVIIVSHTKAHESIRRSWQEDLGNHLVRFVCGPIFGSRLDEMLFEIDDAYGKYLASQNDDNIIAALKRVDLRPNSVPKPFINGETVSSLNTKPPQLRALLVDDNHVNLKVLEMFCKKRSIPHTKSQDGLEAITAYKHASKTPADAFNLILMDLQMPKCDGIEASRRIREIETERGLPRCKIFIVTGQDSMSDRQSSLEVGADEYFVKPVSLKRLGSAIQDHFPAAPQQSKKNSHVSG